LKYNYFIVAEVLREKTLIMFIVFCFRFFNLLLSVVLLSTFNSSLVAGFLMNMVKGIRNHNILYQNCFMSSVN